MDNITKLFLFIFFILIIFAIIWVKIESSKHLDERLQKYNKEEDTDTLDTTNAEIDKNTKKPTKFCFNCGKEIDKNAVICIHCGVRVAEEKKQSGGCLGCLIVFLIFDAICGLIWFFAWMGPVGDAFVETSMNSTSNMLANDAAKKFEIARKSKDYTTMCIEAGVAAQFYLDSKNETNYKEWKKIEKQACRAAGMDF